MYQLICHYNGIVDISCQLCHP